MNINFRSNVGQRITIIATCFSLPIAVLFFFVFQSIGEFITFAEFERKGNAYQRPLEAVLDGVVTYQTGMRRNGAPDAAAKAKVDKAIFELVAADKELGTDLQFTTEGLGKRDRAHLQVTMLKKEWEEAAATSGAAANGKIDHVVSDLRGFITHAGDTSNLILDPDLDSYYLMDVTLLALPQTQDRLGKIVNIVLDLLERGNITADERTQIAVHAALLEESDLSRVMGSAQTALKEDANFYGKSASLQVRLPPALADYEAKSKAMIEMTRQVAAGANVDRAAYFEVGQKAIASSFAAWNVGVQELDVLLQARIDAYTARRVQTTILSALAVLVAILLAWLIKSSITNPLRKLVGSLGPGGVLLSECAAMIKTNNDKGISSREETAIICGELMAHADDMRAAVTQLDKLIGSNQPATI